mgnify:CR=1 FL=1
MMKAEASDLADKIEYALKTEGKITLFQTDGARALYAVRNLAEAAGQPQTSKEAREKEITRLATIEECAQIAEAQAETFLSPEYAANQPFGSLCERFACEEVAKAIRSLADTRPDGNSK